jgi:hypothetical protein
VAASRSVSVYRPDASSRPASEARTAYAAAGQAASAQEEECAGPASARSGEEFVAVEQARSGWAQAGYSAAMSADGWAPADLVADDLVPNGWAGLLVADWAPRCSVPAGCSAPADSDGQTSDDSIPADYSARVCRGESRGSLYARLECWPVAELPRDSPFGHKVSQTAWQARLRGH